MARETAAERKAREAQERAQYEAARAAYHATLPLVLLQLMARASKTHGEVSANVSTDHEGLPAVTFSFPREHATRYRSDDTMDYQLNLYSEQYEVEQVTGEFDRMDAEKAEAARLLKVAQETYDAMSEDQRKALGLTRRPT